MKSHINEAFIHAVIALILILLTIVSIFVLKNHCPIIANYSIAIFFIASGIFSVIGFIHFVKGRKEPKTARYYFVLITTILISLIFVGVIAAALADISKM